MGHTHVETCALKYIKQTSALKRTVTGYQMPDVVPFIDCTALIGTQVDLERSKDFIECVSLLYIPQ